MFVFQAVENGVPQVLAEVTVPTGTATQLTTTSPSRGARVGVMVQSIAANSVKVYVGPSGVTTTTGIELAAGDSVLLPISDPSKIYSISGSSGQKLHVLWV